MPKIDELTLAKELIRFPTITPNDSGIMKFLEKKLKKLGFKQVFQLKGGIINYLNKSDKKDNWKGDCFVFDDRITL